jgi:hypothetical protein
MRDKPPRRAAAPAVARPDGDQVDRLQGCVTRRLGGSSWLARRNVRCSARPELSGLSATSTRRTLRLCGFVTAATIVVSAAPGAPLQGWVAYIDPRFDPATRTGGCASKARGSFEPGRDLRLGLCSESADDGDLGRLGPRCRGRIDVGTCSARGRPVSGA